jgi:hypothetical protein
LLFSVDSSSSSLSVTRRHAAYVPANLRSRRRPSPATTGAPPTRPRPEAAN